MQRRLAAAPLQRDGLLLRACAGACRERRGDCLRFFVLCAPSRRERGLPAFDAAARRPDARGLRGLRALRCRRARSSRFGAAAHRAAPPGAPAPPAARCADRRRRSPGRRAHGSCGCGCRRSGRPCLRRSGRRRSGSAGRSQERLFGMVPRLLLRSASDRLRAAAALGAAACRCIISARLSIRRPTAPARLERTGDAFFDRLALLGRRASATPSRPLRP